jgi:hypothetical protein
VLLSKVKDSSAQGKHNIIESISTYTLLSKPQSIRFATIGEMALSVRLSSPLSHNRHRHPSAYLSALANNAIIGTY